MEKSKYKDIGGYRGILANDPFTIGIKYYEKDKTFKYLGSLINNLREKFSPGPGIEPGSPALRAGAITTKPPRRSAGPS